MAERIPARLGAADGRKFGLTVGIAFLVLTGPLYFWRHRAVAAQVFAGLGTALVLASLVVPTMLGSLERRWMAIARAISKVTTPVFMGIAYFVVLAPVGVIMRLLGRNPLVAKRRGGSVWVPRQRPRGDLERQF